MTFLVVTHVVHSLHGGRVYAYGPYVREMNIWLQHVGDVRIACPVVHGEPDPIDAAYDRTNLTLLHCPAFDLMTVKNIFRSILAIPASAVQILRGMLHSDHLHIRSAGNLAFLALFLQLFFPWKRKTVKFAGNWDPEFAYPLTVRIQRRLFAAPWFSRHTSVLVYGEWPGQSRNVVPFFTASYSQDDAGPIMDRTPSPDDVRCLFVGALDAGKRPQLALDFLVALRSEGISARLDFFGEGAERHAIEERIRDLALEDACEMHGNVPLRVMTERYMTSHFLVHLSAAEGWPKAVSEAMFWGCVPIVTRVSCVPMMLGQGARGILFDGRLASTVAETLCLINDPDRYRGIAARAAEWSRQYTLERFVEAIRGVLG